MGKRVVKVFIASSKELTPEREKFDTLFNNLNSIFSIRGIRLEPVKWEFLDSSMGPLHKQEEYNRKIKDCDICVVMFWQRFGSYTETELNVANIELLAGRKPTKIFVFFKEPGDYCNDLQEFKLSFETKYGHFYNIFDCPDKLQLDFVLQLERYLHSNLIKVENSQVKMDEVVVAHLDNIGFAAGNDKYKSLRERLIKLKQEISSLDTICKNTPNETIENILNEKKSEQHKLEEELSEYENLLLGSAIRVAQFAGERISDRMKRAITLFEQGKVSEANTVLDEAERDADEILRSVREVKTLGRQSVDELLFKASVMLADENFSIEERIAKTDEIYTKANQLAQECDYEENKYAKLLFIYGDFLMKFAKYDKAEQVYLNLIPICERLYGIEHPNTASSYNNIGNVYSDKGDYDSALDFYNKALQIRKKVLGLEHLDTAMSYNNIGSVYSDKGDYDSALDFYNKALQIYEKVLGLEHPNTASSYNNIGNVYSDKGDYDSALDFHNKALQIYEKVLGLEHPDTATSYNNIGNVYSDKGDYDSAFDFHNKALQIRKKVLGLEHPDTATSYNNIGNVYSDKGDYDSALDFYNKALQIRKKVLRLEHPDTAMSYNNIGYVYHDKGDYDSALDFYNKALQIRKKVLGLEHPDTASSYYNIGLAYYSKDNYDSALDHFTKALQIREKIYDETHPIVLNCKKIIDSIKQET